MKYEWQYLYAYEYREMQSFTAERKHSCWEGCLRVQSYPTTVPVGHKLHPTVGGTGTDLFKVRVQ